MAEDPSNDIPSEWKWLREELEFARHYHEVYQDFAHDTIVPAHPFLEYLLPALLYLRAVSILDEALSAYITAKGLAMPKKYHKTLGGRIWFLSDRGLLSDPTVVSKVKDRRNKIGHEPPDRSNLQEYV